MALLRRVRAYKVVGCLIFLILVFKLAIHQQANTIEPDEDPRGLPHLGPHPRINQGNHDLEVKMAPDPNGPIKVDLPPNGIKGQVGVSPVEGPVPDDTGGLPDDAVVPGEVEDVPPREVLMNPREVQVTAAPEATPLPDHMPLPPRKEPTFGKQGNQDVEIQVPKPVASRTTNNTMVVAGIDSVSNNTLIIPHIVEEGNMNGHLGAPVVVNASALTPEEKAKYDKGWKDYQFNEYVSNMIPLHRQLPRIKLEGCGNQTFVTKNLPDTSVIIVFHNEAWSVLLRTMYSVIDTSPPELLKEIILVDDASDLPHLGKPLETYIAGVPKARVLRTPTWGGLIQARLLGARHAQGTVLTFLDSHCECFPGWLEPLLQRIALNSTTVVCPFIESINDTDFRAGESGLWSMGGFDWDLIFQWKNPNKQREAVRVGKWDVLTSPTMAGGLFSIDKKFFEHLGAYDPEFTFWGGENMEISFKIWMCGGRLELLPCSLVGHVFRRHSPHTSGNSWTQINHNSARVAEVWMDQYKYIFYRNNDDNKPPEFGNVSARIALRKSLHCKSFDWYLRHAYPEQPIPRLYGRFQNQGVDRCLDTHATRASDEKKIIAYPCNNGSIQRLMLTEQDEFRIFDKCLDHFDGNISMVPCHEMKGQQQWIYGKDHTVRLSSGGCLTMKADDRTLVVVPCDVTNPRHLWKGPPPLPGFPGFPDPLQL